MKINKLFLAAFVTLLSCATAHAHDFEVDGIYYKILSSSDLTVEVTFKGDLPSLTTDNKYVGKVEIPESVTYSGKTYSVTGIGFAAFDFCQELTSVTIPNSVTSIGESAFYQCYKMKSVTIPNSVMSLGNSAFRTCGITSINIPNSVTSIGYNTFSGSNLTSIIVEDGNSIFDSRDNCNAIIETATNTLITGCNNTVIPNSVTSISNHAFYEHTNLTSITIPNSVTSIGTHAFYGCSGLTSITIPISVTSIGDWAFNNCNNLTSVTVESKTPITLSSDDAFSHGFKATLNVPSGSKAAYEAAEYWKDFGEIVEYNKNIEFADAKVKELCVVNWDINGDGELSQTEAAAVSDLGSVFKSNENIITFEELLYFTGLTSINNYVFSGCSGLTSITIPNSVMSIGDYVFSGCSSLTSITIPNSVTSIGERAFYGCSGLTSITVGNSVTSIGDYAFGNCSGLTSVHISDIAAWFRIKFEVLGSNPLWFAHHLYKDGKEVTNLNIPEGVTSINDVTFAGCSSFTSVTIPNSVTNIGAGAFGYCSGITSIMIPGSVTSIGEAAFEGCNLASVTVESKTPITLNGGTFSNQANATLYVPLGSKAAYETADVWKEFKEIIEGSEYIKFKDANAKEYCVVHWDTNDDGELSTAEAAAVTDLGEIPISLYNVKSFNELQYFIGLTSIGDRPFAGSSDLTSITIPNSVTSIGSSAFSGCSGLTSITIPNSVTSIGSSAFSGCSGLTSITIPNSVTSISSSAFSGCSGLTSVIVDIYNSIYDSRDNCNAIIETATNTLHTGCKNTVIPNSVTNIGSSAFSGCSGLTSLDIPSSVTNIGSSAFYGCSGLTSVTIPNSVTSIGNDAFRDCSSLTSIDIPNSVTSIGEYAFRDCSGLTSITIPNSVTSIGSYAFGWCSGLTSIHISDIAAWCNIEFSDYTANPLYYANHLYMNGKEIKDLVIPEGVTSIGDYAFLSCSGLTSIEIPNSVTSIGSYAFSSCSGLTSIEIPNSVTSIGSLAFSFCSGLTSVTIGNSVTSIGDGAFGYCSSLTSITIPISVTSIGYSAFEGCYNLTSVKVENETPISLDDSYTFSNRVNATLYVPAGSKAAYEAADYWKEFKEIVELAPTSVTISINQYGSGTYCSEHALDFTDVEGMKAYVGIGFNIKTSTLIMSQVRTVKPGVGLYIKGEPGEYKIPIIKESDENYINLMVGTLSKVTVNSQSDDGQYTNFKYTIKSGDAEPKFYVFSNNSSLSANKAYLQLPTKWLPGISTSKTINLAFEDEDITGIDEVATDRPEGKPVVYDLQGRRVINPGKGLYIVNGKKVLMK